MKRERQRSNPRQRGNAGYWTFRGRTVLANVECTRMLSEAGACVPAMSGSLTFARLRAGWHLYLTCPRQCRLTVRRNFVMWANDVPVLVNHCCEARCEELNAETLPELTKVTRVRNGVAESIDAYVFETVVIPEMRARYSRSVS